ncbi:hypothetical protein V1264_015620 [Littorina saxatilis]
MVQDNRQCQTENVVVVTGAKTTICRNAQQTRCGGDSKTRDKTTVSIGRRVEGADNTQSQAMMKDGTQVEERQTIFLAPKMHGAPFREERAFHTDGMESFPELHKVSKNIDRIAASLSCKDTEYFDHGYSKEASLRFLRCARNEALLPAGIFDVQTVAPSTLYDPIAFFRSPLERLRWEFWRLCTFAPLSDNLSVSPIRLAQSGFYYDEEQDDIICFSCDLRKRHWSENEKTVAVVHLALNEHCLQANFSDDTNVAIETDTPRLSSTPGTGLPPSEVYPRVSRDDSGRTDYEVPDGLQSSESSESSFSRNQYHFNGVTTANHTLTSASQRSSQNGHTAAISGGNEQNGQVQAYSLPPPISRAEEISSHRQMAALSAGTALQQTVVSCCTNASDAQRTSTTNTPEVAAAADHSQYPVQPEQAPEAVPPETLCYGSQGNSEEHSALESDGDHSETSGLDMRRAACPGNSSVKGRLASFGDWPGAGLPTPRDLVPAGFYYMGTGDSVRCFYCGVTLRNWREHDDPWLTHVRFRFSCAYVTAIKGENFVLQALVKHANGQPVTGEAEETE